MSSTSVSAVVFAALAALYAATRAPADGDMWWHLASGAWMLEHGTILDRDVFSFTRAGAEYRSGQWLGQIALELVSRAGGWPAVVLLRSALVGISAYFVASATLRLQPSVAWAAVPILATVLVSSTTWGDRPQLWTVAFFPLVLDVALAVRLGAPPRRLMALPPLFLVWANLHGGFVAGLGLMAIFTAEAAISRAASARPLAVATVASLVLSQLNPAGVGAVGWAASYAATRAPFIVEERPVPPTSATGITFGALALAAVASAAVLRRRIRGIPAALLWPMLAIPFALLGVTVQRHLPLACAVLAPFVASVIPAALGRAHAGAPRLAPVAGRSIFAAIVLSTTAVAAAIAPRAPDLDGYPAGALAHLSSISGHLLHEYDWGGYLIREAPAHPTFIDGRGALLFVPDVLDDFQQLVDARPGYAGTLRRWDIAAALIRPDRPLASALTAAGWRRVAAREDRWVLLARP